MARNSNRLFLYHAVLVVWSSRRAYLAGWLGFTVFLAVAVKLLVKAMVIGRLDSGWGMCFMMDSVPPYGDLSMELLD